MSGIEEEKSEELFGEVEFEIIGERNYLSHDEY